LRRLAAKQGWYEGHSGLDGNAPSKTVMGARGGVAHNPVPADEEAAYWRGYDEGVEARGRGLIGNANPYARAT
jgi:hypothetical protein